MTVVKTHHSKIQLGTDFPSLDRLDGLIDEALKGK